MEWDEAVEEIFSRDHELETLYLAVYFLDRYTKETLQGYHLEVVHACLNLVAKSREDHSYFVTHKSISETCCLGIPEWEWKVGSHFNFYFAAPNFLKVFSSTAGTEGKFHSVFFDLTKQVCLNKSLLEVSPEALTLGVLLLAKKKKLSALKLNRERKFVEICFKMCFEFDVEPEEFISAVKQTFVSES